MPAIAESLTVVQEAMDTLGHVFATSCSQT